MIAGLVIGSFFSMEYMEYGITMLMIMMILCIGFMFISGYLS